MARDFGHNADAIVNRGRKAGRLYLRMCHDGLLQLPEDAETRQRIRKAVGLPRPPSEETWALAGAMLAAWPPAHAPLDLPPGGRADCGCWVGEDDGLLYEHLPADRDAAGVRFEGWLCPHTSPVYLGEPREVSRIPTVDDQQRAAYALEAVQTGAVPPALGLDVEVDPDLPPGVAEIRQPDGSVAARITVDAAGEVTSTEILQPAEPVQLPEGWTIQALPVNPHRITVALDRAGLQGPTADAKLGAVEPALDRWEAGREQPTAAQLERLAAMANVPIEFFWLPDDAEPRLIAARVHLGGRKGCQWVITMTGEPAGRPQEELPGAGDWWDA